MYIPILFGFFGILATLSYVGRNLTQMISFPLDGVNGFDYMRLKEVSSVTILTVFIFTYSSILASKSSALKSKLGV